MPHACQLRNGSFPRRPMGSCNAGCCGRSRINGLFLGLPGQRQGRVCSGRRKGRSSPHAQPQTNTLGEHQRRLSSGNPGVSRPARLHEKSAPRANSEAKRWHKRFGEKRVKGLGFRVKKKSTPASQTVQPKVCFCKPFSTKEKQDLEAVASGAKVFSLRRVGGVAEL